MKIKSVNIPDFEEGVGNDLYDQLLNKLSSALERIEKYKKRAVIKRCHESDYSIYVKFRNTDYPDLRDTELFVYLEFCQDSKFEMGYRKTILKSGFHSTEPGISSEERITFVGDKEKDKKYLDKFKDIYKQVAFSYLEDL